MQEQVKEAFELYPEINTFYVTTDLQCFTSPGNARLHAKWLEDDTIHVMHRNAPVYGPEEQPTEQEEAPEQEEVAEEAPEQEEAIEEAPEEEEATEEVPAKLSAQERIAAIEACSTVEEVDALMNGERAKTVIAAGEARIKAINEIGQ
jgi:hypothetical protein